MSTVLQGRALARGEPARWLPWIAILLGLAALYVPTGVDLARGLWRDDAYAHGPIIAAVFGWLVWRSRAALVDESSPPAPLLGAATLALGLALYLLGRTQSLMVFEAASVVPVAAGAVLLLRGTSGLHALAFPILFLAFLVPLPGFVLDFVSVPLKEVVSSSVEWLLQLLSYPVEREGVVLFVGDHQMLVADACSGLNSLYSLLALGLLYAHVTDRKSSRSHAARTALLLLAVLPIAVIANIVRVLGLVLVTYHFGEDAARGPVHDLAGLLVFGVALQLLVGWDAVVRTMLSGKQPAPREEVAFVDAALPHLTTRRTSSKRRAATLALVAGVAMAGTAAASPALKPKPDTRPAPDLERVIPSAFGDWRLDAEVVPVVPAPDVQAKLDRLYRQVVSRTYVNSRGERMMLTVAHGGDQSDALKAHRQEACYAAQGFDIRRIEHGTLSTAGRTLPVTRMLAVKGDRSEPVTYWFTMGERVVLGRGERLRVQLENGFAGRIPDGMLVRVSSLSEDARTAFASQQSFIAAIAGALPAGEAARFVGRADS
ncbi:MAG: exosortase-associated protein EpsI, B-type [Usitatibacter sp.]